MPAARATGIRVGLIGAGWMGRCHALAYRAVTGVFDGGAVPVLAVVSDIDGAAAQAAAARFGFERWTDDWRTVVDDDRIDVVSIATPNAAHKEIAVAAAARGKHVYCEKPMALTLDDAEAMAAAAQQGGVRTLVGYNYVRNPAVRHAKALIDAGAIGRVAGFRGVYDEDYMADGDLPYTWRCRIADAGTGTLGDLASHLISVAHFLVGPIAAVSAVTDIVHRHRPIPDRPGETGAVENEDVAHALVRFADGATGLVSSSRVAWGRKCRLAWEITGTTGSITFDQERMNELCLFQGGEPARNGFKTILTGPDHPPYDRFVPAPGHGLGFNDLKVIEVDHLLSGLTGQTRLFPDFDDALMIERVIHGIVASAGTGQWVTTRPDGP